MQLKAKLAVLWIGVALLASCGGGGGDGAASPAPAPPAPAPSPPAPAAPGNFNLSGAITVAPNAVVDSDTNDINQTAYRVNDTVAQAQTLNSPALLVGTVNEPNTGPAGTNFSVGDVDDVFRVALTAGQVVELEFSADPANADVDLAVVSEDGTQVGTSEGLDTRFECVEVRASGNWFVVVRAFRSASIYNMRIGAPGTAGACAQRTAPANFAPNQLLALPKASSSERASALANAQERSAGVRKLASPAGAGPQVLRLPEGARERAQGLRVLAGGSGAKSLGGRATAASSERAAAAEEVWSTALDTLAYAKRLRATGAYAYVQPDWLQQRHALVGNFPPSDRGYSYQRWHYEQINLPAAMARIAALPTQPAQRPIAAIIDDGIILNHPDLAPQLFSNGRAFISINGGGDGNTASAEDPSRSADNPSFHGTHVAGTVAAATFNGIGAAGVAPMAQLLPLRVFAPGRGAATSDVVNAMLYAAALPNNSGTLPARRADVINMSLGGDRSCEPAFQTAIDQVRAAGVVVVVAAGNSARNDRGQRVAVGSPANCNGAIAVSATDNRQAVTSYSNTGAQIRVAAPGGDTSQSTTGNGAPDGIYSDIGSFDAAGQRQPSFGALQGTSMATPHVAGVIALMRYVNPALTPVQIDTLFTQGALTEDRGAAGRDIDYGFGLIDARKAVDAALDAAGNPPPAPAGAVIAAPSSIDFGSLQTAATLELTTSGATSERVVSIAADTPAVTVAAVSGAVDATTRLGRYTVSVDRAALAGRGSFFPKLTVTLTPARSFTVQLSVTKPDPAVAGGGDFGPVYVLLIDPDTDRVLTTVLATRNATGYSWSATGYSRSRVAILAGGDLDNDNLICQRGEPCGAFPVLETTGNATPVELTGDRNDLSFRLAPLSGISVQATGSQERLPGWRRGAATALPR